MNLNKIENEDDDFSHIPITKLIKQTFELVVVFLIWAMGLSFMLYSLQTLSSQGFFSIAPIFFVVGLILALSSSMKMK